MARSTCRRAFPDFSPSPLLLERVTHHMAAGANQYPPMAGVAALREAIAEKVARLYLASYDPESEVTVTAGATQAIYTAIAACVRSGDEVIVFAPVYDSYVPGIELNGGRAVYAHLRFPELQARLGRGATPDHAAHAHDHHQFAAQPERFAVWSADDMAMLETLVRDTKIVVVSDEVYEHVVFDPTAAPTSRRHESVTPLSGLARAQLRGFQFRQDLPRDRLEGGLLPGAARADQRVPQGAPVHRVHRASSVATRAGRFHARPAGVRRQACGLLPGAARDFFRRQLEGSRFELLPCSGTYFQFATYSTRSATSRTRSFVQRLTSEHSASPRFPYRCSIPTAEDRRVIRFCFAKNESTLAAAGERLRKI
jgi:methionine aminotransferase